MLTPTVPERQPAPLRPAERAERRAFLPEVQALRALAVSLVVVYHFWPERLSGGFVGVDVFFVISGFLITSHLHREVASRGTISLPSFYARRARRLLPAAALVLLATAAATAAFLPVTRWATSATDILASAFYVQNWVLADRSVDYSASRDAASAVQHFWSLAVEEQFYLVWPPLILLLLLIARRLRRAGRDALLLGGILAVTVASLGWSVHATATDPAAAYFVTPTRLWELGAGAVLSLWSGTGWSRSASRRIALRWAGVAAILASAVALSAGSPFPGYLALLPVLGTVAVIHAGDTGGRDPLSVVVGLRPVQLLGDVSYALYLWHWPVIVIAPFVLGRAPGLPEQLLLVALCLVLAWLTRVFVEVPTQRWRPLARPLPAAAFTVAAMLAVSGAAALQWQAVDRHEDAARTRLVAAQEDPCFGAAALAPDAPSCGDVFGPPATLTAAPGDEPWFGDPACHTAEGPLEVAVCRFGDGPPTATVALVGDSHAQHWRGALHRLAEANGWELIEIFRGGCPATAAPVVAFNSNPADTEGCQAWGRRVTARLIAERPDAVFTSAFAPAFTFADGGRDASLERGSEGFAETWTAWADAGMQVFALRDVPTTGDRDIPECLATHSEAPLECASPREDAVRADAMTLAAAQAGTDRVQLVDLSDYFCDRTTCYAAIGGAVVYHDRDHITASFSRSLAPFLLDRISGVWAVGAPPS